jgi:STE24 endopeptidase
MHRPAPFDRRRAPQGATAGSRPAAIVSTASAVVVLALLASASAGAVALASRTPLEVRRDSPPKDATRASLGATFTAAQVARHGAYRGPAYLALGLGTALQVATLVVLARGPWGRLVALLERVPGGLLAHAAAAGVALSIVALAVALPVSFVRGFAMEKAWGLSTQDVAGWATDQARAALVGAVTAALAAAAYLGVVRWQPKAWWLWGWAAFTLLSATLVFLWPVVIAPLFNRFTPLPDEALATRVRAVARAAGVDIQEVLVADASRRSTAENAYVAGLGATKRMVLYDTLLRAGDEDETIFVVAHELGHEAEDHVIKNVILSSGGLLVGFALLAWLATRTWMWSWAGASGPGDVRALPVVAMFAVLMSLVTLPLETAVSRHFEARADEIAISLTNAPDTAVRTFRRLAFANLADLDPPRAAVSLLYTHPPLPDRIRAILSAPSAGTDSS